MKKLGLPFIFACLFTVSLWAAPVLNRFTLSNGLEVTVIPVRQNPVVASTFVFNVGLKHETARINGVSHLLEHLTFNGTESRTQKQIYEDIDRVGAYINASTGDHYTAYYLLAPVETFQSAFLLQTDMLFHSIIPEDKVDKEKGIVLEEIRKARVRPAFREEQAVRSLLFPEQPYGLQVIGSEESVMRIGREGILEFYERYYVPANGRLLIVGDVDTGRIRKFLEERVGTIESGQMVGQTSDVQMNSGDDAVVRKVTGLRNRTLHYMIEGARADDPAYEAQEVAIQLLEDELKRDLADLDPNVSLYADVTSDYTLIHLQIQLEDGVMTEPDKIRERFADIAGNLKPNSRDIERKVKMASTAMRFHLERPHFFGMMVAADLAAGRGIPLNIEAPSVDAVTGALNRMAKPDRSMLILLKPDQTEGKVKP